MTRREHLDPNFATLQPGSDLHWYDAETLTVSGRGWPVSELATPWVRLPTRAAAIVRPEVWQLSRHSAGLAIEFATDSPEISAQWTVENPSLAMDHMPATGVSGLDLYVLTDHGWRWVGTGRPQQGTTNRMCLVAGIPPGPARTYRLYLPLYNTLTTLQLGIAQTARITAIPAATRRSVVFYGTSIVHGGCASRPGMTYPALVSRALNIPQINLGFSGNGRAEPEVAQLLAELSPALFVIDPLPNLSEPQVSERIPTFIAGLRERHPQLPLLLVGNITYQQPAALGKHPADCARKNAALREVFSRLSATDPHLHHLAGEDLLGDDGEATVDGVHPTDAGFLRMAQVIAPAVAALLPQE
jgi:lysophospholipase L1-like esterase